VRGGRAFRFAPPPLALPAAIRWLLRAAFGPRPLELEAPAPAAAVGWAGALALGERIAARHPRDELVAALGAGGAARLDRWRKRAAADQLRIRQLAAEVTRRAAAQGVELALLKGAALLDRGATPAGGRRLFDLDVLVAPAAGARLAAALDGAGYRTLPEPGERHLAPRAHPELGLVEIHTRLPGVAIAGAPATLPALAAAGLCRPADATSGALAPRRELLSAHLLAHALDQHGLSPAGYPALRLYGDLLDLWGPSARPRDGNAAAVELALSPREIAAAHELAAALATGAEPAAGSDAARLLGHAVAGAIDHDYRRALRVSGFGRALARREWHKLERSEASGGGVRDGDEGLFGVGCAWIRTHLRRRRLMAPSAPIPPNQDVFSDSDAG